MDRKFKTAACAGGAILLGFAFLVSAFSTMARAGDSPALASATIHGLEGNRIALSAPPGGACVLIFYSTECPISNSYSPTLKSLVESFAADKVKWVGICVDPDLSDSVVKAHVRDFNLKFPVARDKHGVLAKKIGATKTPEAFLIDDAGRIRYHGRIDDQFAARQKRNVNPSTNDLKDALEARLERQGDQERFRGGYWLSDARGASGEPAHVQQACGRDPSAELSGMPPEGPGRAIFAGIIRPGAEACF